MGRYKPDYTTAQLSARATERIMLALRGSTLTAEDAKKLMDEIQMCVPPEPKDKEK